MRCPNCAGEIPAGSRFCGICGRNITVAPEMLAHALGDGASARGRWPHAAAAQPEVQAAMSLFELPVSRRGRAAKLALVLVLDAILAGAGIVMIWSYLGARRGPEPAQKTPPAAKGTVEVLAPKVAPAPAEVPAAATVGTAGKGPMPDKLESRQPAAAPLAKPVPTRPAESAPVRPAESPPARPAESPPARPAESPPARPAEPATGAAVEEAGEETNEEVDDVSARLTQVVQSHAGDLERCYQRAAKVSGPSDPLEGRIDVHLTVMPDGTARDVRAGENTTGSAQLADCVIALFRSWTLPAGATQPIGLLWPLQFRPPAK